MNKKILKSLTKACLVLCLFVFNYASSFAQSITWGPTVPAINADNLQACESSGNLSFGFTNSTLPLNTPTIEIQLDSGINYVQGSLTYSVNLGAVITEGDLSNLNRPQFTISNLQANESVQVSIARTANCQAKDYKINGNSFRDSVLIYENATPVTYLGGNGTIEYDLTYAILSITNPITSPSTTNIASQSTRTLQITNGSFGAIQNFYFADIAPAAEVDLSNFVINPGGNASSIPAGNISINGDSVIIHFDASLINAIDGSQGNGNGNGLFEKDEQFVLSYQLSPTQCGSNNTISSSLLVWWGCDYNTRCQVNESGSSLGLTNGIPVLNLSNAVKPPLDFCDTITYAVKITNNSTETLPAGGAFAKDLAVIIGLRANNSLIATPANMTMWGSAHRNVKHFSNIRINDSLITAGTLNGIYGNPVDYIPADFFTTDPDGPGGLEDLDNDGYFDDLANDSSIIVSFDVYINPESSTCGTGRFDYIKWEHISADVSWENQCGVPMSPMRQEFNYTNFIRDYLLSTEFSAPADIMDGNTFSVGVKPYLYNTINCNGANGNTASGVDWSVFITLPPGVSLAPGATHSPAHNTYDPSFLQSNDTVFYTIDRYKYEWFNFDLQFDCATWDNNTPVSIPIQTVYTCKDEKGNICFQEALHCQTLTMVPHCPGNCVGVSQTDFTALRSSGGWTDNTQSTPVTLNSTDHELSIVYPKDTVQFISSAVLTDTMTNQLYAKITYSPDDGTDIFDFADGIITILDKDGGYNGGQTSYSTNITTPPIKNNLGNGNYEMIFDLSSYRTIVDADYLYGEGPGGSTNYQDDAITLTANFVISDASTSISLNPVNNFRASYYLLDDNAAELSCNSLGTNLNYTYSYYTAGTGVSISEACNTFILPLYLTHRANSGDDFPNEYRPDAHIDSVVISIPDNWTVGTISFYDGNIVAESDYDIRSNQSLLIRRPAYYKDFDKVGTHYPKVRVEFIPDCNTAIGKTFIDYKVHYKKWTYINDPAVHQRDSVSSSSSYLEYTPPSFALTPLNQSFSDPSDTAIWEVRICNSTSDMDVHYNWLVLDPEDGAVQVEQVFDVSSGTETAIDYSSFNSNNIFIEIDSLSQGACKNVRIYATYASCTNDTISVRHGWNCTGYPTPSESVSCSDETELYVLPQEAQISSTITEIENTPIDPSDPLAGNFGNTEIVNCVPFPVEMQIVSAQPGAISDLSLDINIPSAGAGLVYISGSATIEVEGIDSPNMPRAFGAVAEAAMVNGSNAGNSTWTIKLEDIDPTNFGNNEDFLGTTNVDQNEIILRWQFQSTCNLNSSDVFSVTTSGNQPCGGPAEGNGETILSSPLDINGITAPYFMSVSSSLSPNTNFQSCSDLKTIESTFNILSGTTTNYDTLSYTLPEGLSYAGSFACQTATCPSFIGTTTTNGKEVILFKHPNNFVGTMTLNFDISTNDVRSCSTNELIDVKSTSQVGAVSCNTGVCPSLKVITGQDNISVNVEKPDLEVQFIELNYTSAATPSVYNYTLDVSNLGYQTEEDIIVQFFCANASADDIEGAVIHSDTIDIQLIQNATERISGSFYASCNPINGVAAIVTPGLSTCYCESLDDLASKSAGLSEIPHDLRSAVFLPVEISSFKIHSQDCGMYLNWTTASEKNNQFFEVQRSNDGQYFKTIGAFPGQGNSSTETHYEYLDTDWRGEQLSYYRLKQIDTDGQFSFSKVISKDWENCYAANTISNIYPNPVKEGAVLNIEFLKEDESDILIEVVDLLGQTIKTLQVQNANLGSNKLEISTEELTSGTYFISIQSLENKWRSAMHKINVFKD